MNMKKWLLAGFVVVVVYYFIALVMGGIAAIALHDGSIVGSLMRFWIPTTTGIGLARGFSLGCALGAGVITVS